MFSVHWHRVGTGFYRIFSIRNWRCDGYSLKRPRLYTKAPPCPWISGTVLVLYGFRFSNWENECGMHSEKTQFHWTLEKSTTEEREPGKIWPTLAPIKICRFCLFIVTFCIFSVSFLHLNAILLEPDMMLCMLVVCALVVSGLLSHVGYNNDFKTLFHAFGVQIYIWVDNLSYVWIDCGNLFHWRWFLSSLIEFSWC